MNPLLALYMCFARATLLICQFDGIKDSRWKIQPCPTAGYGQPHALLNYASRSQFHQEVKKATYLVPR